MAGTTNFKPLKKLPKDIKDDFVSSVLAPFSEGGLLKALTALPIVIKKEWEFYEKILLHLGNSKIYRVQPGEELFLKTPINNRKIGGKVNQNELIALLALELFNFIQKLNIREEWGALFEIETIIGKLESTYGPKVVAYFKEKDIIKYSDAIKHIKKYLRKTVNTKKISRLNRTELVQSLYPYFHQHLKLKDQSEIGRGSFLLIASILESFGIEKGKTEAITERIRRDFDRKKNKEGLVQFKYDIKLNSLKQFNRNHAS